MVDKGKKHTTGTASDCKSTSAFSITSRLSLGISAAGTPNRCLQTEFLSNTFSSSWYDSCVWFNRLCRKKKSGYGRSWRWGCFSGNAFSDIKYNSTFRSTLLRRMGCPFIKLRLYNFFMYRVAFPRLPISRIISNQGTKYRMRCLQGNWQIGRVLCAISVWTSCR